MVNLNTIAKKVTLDEGLKKSISIGQCKELMKLLFTRYDLEAIVEMWQKYNR